MGKVRDAVEQALSAIRDPQSDGLIVYTRLYDEAARASADEADARIARGLERGPLDGAIISIKDLFDVAGETTMAGAKLRRTAPPATADAPAVSALKAAGAVIIGKTNMTEFAFSGIGINPHFGTPGNGADKRHVPGGSTAGGGVSVVEGTCRIAIGSDTGGSTRIPAAFNGCVGFKPSQRRITRDGAFPLSWSLDSIGPLARTVADCALADSVLAGEAPKPLARHDGNPRLGVPRGRLLDGCEPEVSAAFDEALGRIGSAGIALADVVIDPLLERFAAANAKGPLAASEAYAIHRATLAERERDYDPRVRSRLMGGATILAADYIATLRARETLIAEMDALLAPFDALILPTAPIRAPKIIDLARDEDFFAANAKALRNTAVGNNFDLCGISIPCPHAGKLPVGLMLMGRNGHDRAVLALAARLEHLLSR